jgi:hypothetical protein
MHLDDPRYPVAVASVRMRPFYPALYAVLGGMDVDDSPLVPNRPAEPSRPVTEEQREEVRELWAEAENSMDSAVLFGSSIFWSPIISNPPVVPVSTRL